MQPKSTVHTLLLLALASGPVVAAEPVASELAPVELLETPLPGSDHIALSLSLDSSLTTSPLGSNSQQLNNLNMDLSYSWGRENHFLRLFSGLRYQVNNNSNSLLSIRDLENHHRTLMGVDWQAGGFIGSVYTEAALPGTVQEWTTPAFSPSYNLEMGWDAGQYGKISIGARNLLDKPQPLNQLESVLDMPEAQGRVPYIRYQIDL